MRGTDELVFHIAYDCIEPVKKGEIGRFVSTRCFDWEVKITNIVETFKILETIRDDKSAWVKVFLPPSHLLRAIETSDAAESYEDGMSFIITL